MYKSLCIQYLFRMAPSPRLFPGSCGRAAAVASADKMVTVPPVAGYTHKTCSSCYLLKSQMVPVLCQVLSCWLGGGMEREREMSPFLCLWMSRHAVPLRALGRTQRQCNLLGSLSSSVTVVRGHCILISLCSPKLMLSRAQGCCGHMLCPCSLLIWYTVNVSENHSFLHCMEMVCNFTSYYLLCSSILLPYCSHSPSTSFPLIVYLHLLLPFSLHRPLLFVRSQLMYHLLRETFSEHSMFGGFIAPTSVLLQ